jgi:hypothetical protein
MVLKNMSKSGQIWQKADKFGNRENRRKRHKYAEKQKTALLCGFLFWSE